jgi:O-antigen/teichoic acid export membrane protein
MLRLSKALGTSGLLRAARRLGWGLSDQVLSSVTNFALSLVVARTVTASDFGAFSIAFVTYTVFMGISRALATEPLLVRFSFSTEEKWRHGTTDATGTTVGIGVGAGIICLVSGWLAAGPLAESLFILGLFLPGLLLQDGWRHSFFSAGRGRDAFLNDLVWALLLFPWIALLIRADSLSVGSLMVAWGGSGSIAGLFGILQARVVPRITRSIGWVREHRDLGQRYLGEFAVSSGTNQLTIYGLGFLASLREVAALRGGQILLGPLNVLFQGTGLVALPEAVRLAPKSRRRLKQSLTVLSIALAALALCWGAVALFIPDTLGDELLGASWEGAREVLLPLSLSVAGFALLIGAMVGLRALGAASRGLKARSLDAPFSLAGGLGGAWLAGAKGAAWGYALVVLIRIPIWWWQFLRALKEYEEAEPAAEDATESSPEATPASEEGGLA